MVRPRSASYGLVAAAVVLTTTLTGCGDDEDPDPPRPPEAPAQELPEPAVEPLADGPAAPVAELADREWVTRTAEVVGIPERALIAYAGATAALIAERPDCGLGWNTLAGIGEVETGHGTHGGSRIGSDGRTEPEIVGPALDGGEGVMEIPDTDGGELDGDDRWDRAVGPMQFIPTTWEEWSRDGTGDGAPDVHHIDDAALTAAAYLCGQGEDMTTDEGWNAAINAYNRSVPYAVDVAEHADRYAADAESAEAEQDEAEQEEG
ncbi:MAG: lytic murein transglycosylase [Nesterenkonia sp.]|nr:lytic murein transglycosylase [Nesterenkonia sp.]